MLVAQELANGCAAKSSGPAAALRYLSSFSVEEAFEVGMKVLTSAPSLRLCRLLVQFLMSLKVCGFYSMLCIFICCWYLLLTRYTVGSSGVARLVSLLLT